MGFHGPPTDYARTNVVSLISLSSPSSPHTYSCYDRKIRAFVFHKSYSTRKDGRIARTEMPKSQCASGSVIRPEFRSYTKR